ncbi:putative gustatory receptor 98b [Lucilia cuprina]|uniref:putative gustatory receptor 98b n=1 Tax=Lucilia cuprina TaxID=7375 RepID=UPI001F058783|nr:putative gustatory receptor 98b [Lucilia cuprina]
MLIACAIWITYKHNYIVSKLTQAHNLDFLTKLIAYIHNIALIILQLSIKYKSWCCNKNLVEILQFINKLDNQMLSKFPHMLKPQMLRKRLFLTTEPNRRVSLARIYSKTLKQNQIDLMEIWTLANKLEQYFAWPILLLFFYNGIDILTTTSWAYVQYVYETRLIYQIFRLTFIGVLLSNMLLLSYLAQKCINEYKKFSQLLNNFQLYPHDKEIILNVREYSLQLMHQRLKFSCSGYMNIDLKRCGKVRELSFKNFAVLDIANCIFLL